MFEDEGVIKIRKDDQCYTCTYFSGVRTCPLLEALALGIVDLTCDTRVQNCGFYEPKLRAVK